MSDYRLTQRDVDVMLDLYKHRYLKTSQIQSLHFPSLQTANRRLRSLHAQKLVGYVLIPNISERIYHISNQGARFVAEQLGVAVSELLWSKNTHQPKDYYFMRHFLAANQFRIDLTQACAKGTIDLLGFIAEHYGTKHPSGRVTKYIKDFVFDTSHTIREKISHTPDGVLALSKNNKPALFFLEIDRGTESLSNSEKGFLKMVRYYVQYAKAQKFKGYSQDFNCSEFKAFRLLIVTTTEKRLENMRKAGSEIRNVSHAFTKFVWLTTFDNVSSNTIFTKIWKPLDIHDRSMYSIGK